MAAPILVAALLLGIADPAAAAIPVNPVQDVIGVGVDAITGGMGGLAVEGFEGLVKTLFAWPARLINGELLAWLVRVPDYAIDPRSAHAGGGSNLAQLGATTSAMAFAALGAVGTVSGIRYWAAGLTGSGGLEALEGFGRTVGAALAIVLWPWLFRRAAGLANEAASGLLGSGSVLEDTARVLAAAFLAAVSFNILSLLVALAAALLLLGLLVTKIALSAGTALVYVAMPLALMLWPIPELAWIARGAMRAFATVLVIPLAWAVCFATFAAVGADALAVEGAGAGVGRLVTALVAVALLWLTVVLPKTLARMALFGAAGGTGFVTRTASVVAARRADAAVVHVAGATTGQGRRPSDDDGSSGGLVATAQMRTPGHGGGAATHVAGSAAGTAAMAAAGPAVGSASAAIAPTAVSRGSRPANGSAAAAGPSGIGGGGEPPRTSASPEKAAREPVEPAGAVRRRPWSTRADVAGAMRTLPPDARREVVELMQTPADRARGQLVRQAARHDLDSSTRDAFHTLAAASPAVRADGVGDFLSAGSAAPVAAPSSEHGAIERGASTASAEHAGDSKRPPASPVAASRAGEPARHPAWSPGPPPVPPTPEGGSSTPPARVDIGSSGD